MTRSLQCCWGKMVFPRIIQWVIKHLSTDLPGDFGTPLAWHSSTCSFCSLCPWLAILFPPDHFRLWIPVTGSWSRTWPMNWKQHVIRRNHLIWKFDVSWHFGTRRLGKCFRFRIGHRPFDRNDPADHLRGFRNGRGSRKTIARIWRSSWRTG